MDDDYPPVVANAFGCHKQLQNLNENMSCTPPINFLEEDLCEITNVEPPAEYQFRLGQENIWFVILKMRFYFWVHPIIPHQILLMEPVAQNYKRSSSTILLQFLIVVRFDNSKNTLCMMDKDENIYNAMYMIRFYTSELLVHHLMLIML